MLPAELVQSETRRAAANLLSKNLYKGVFRAQLSAWKVITSKSKETIQIHSKAYTFKTRQSWVFGALLTASFSKSTMAAKYDKEGRNMRKGVLKNS